MARKPRKAANGSGSIQKLPDGRYRAFVTVGITAAGNPKRISKIGETLREAEAWLMTMTLQRDTGALVLPSDATLTELVDKWEEDNPQWAPSTTADRIGTLRRHVTPYVGDKRVRDLTPGHVTGLMGMLRRERPSPVDTKKTLHGISEATAHRVLRHLRACLDHAVQIELAPRNATAGIRIANPKPGRRPRWSIEDTRAVLAAAAEYGQKHVVGNYLYTALMTGMRREELRGLRWQDIDTKEQAITVRQVVTEIDGHLHYGPPKTDASQREIVVDAGTMRILEQQREHQSIQRKNAKSWEDRDLVFSNRRGGPLRYKQLRHHMNAIAAIAEVPEIRLYDTRSTHGSILAETGVNPKAISERLGHTDVGFTMRTYVRTDAGEQRAVAEMMGSLGVQPCATEPDKRKPEPVKTGQTDSSESTGKADKSEVVSVLN